jgi:hypothetical protein
MTEFWRRKLKKCDLPPGLFDFAEGSRVERTGFFVRSREPAPAETLAGCGVLRGVGGEG